MLNRSAFPLPVGDKMMVQSSIQALQNSNRPIAVVDDNTDDRFFLKRELAFLFGEVEILNFQSGAALLHYLQGHFKEDEDPWLILLDLHMTNIDGFKTLDFLRSRRRFAEIPVIVTSGTLNSHEIKTALGQGANAFLSKPVSRGELIKVLNGKYTPLMEMSH